MKDYVVNDGREYTSMREFCQVNNLPRTSVRLALNNKGFYEKDGLRIESRTYKLDKLKEAALPLIKLLNEDYHPHVAAIVTTTSVELLEGIASVPNIFDYVKD